MAIISSIVLLVIFGILLFTAGVVPRKGVLSIFELERRREEGSRSAMDELRRLEALEDIVSLLRVAEATALIGFAVVASATWSIFGVILAILVALLYRRLARTEIIRTNCQRLYDENERKLVTFTERYPQVGRIIGGLAAKGDDTPFGSREELEHLIAQSTNILTPDEKKLLKSNLHFAEKTVESVMTPRGVIESVDGRELLGPIVLDQLHKTGHSRFPVIDGDIDHVVGVLHIRELLALGNKSSQTAREAMEQKVYYINQSQTLQHALAAFLSTRHHLFIVVNEYRETAGIITLEDCIEALIGRKIVDEYDTHDDLRAVASRNAKHNNDSPHGTDV